MISFLNDFWTLVERHSIVFGFLFTNWAINTALRAVYLHRREFMPHWAKATVGFTDPIALNLWSLASRFFGTKPPERTGERASFGGSGNE